MQSRRHDDRNTGRAMFVSVTLLVILAGFIWLAL